MRFLLLTAAVAALAGPCAAQHDMHGAGHGDATEMAMPPMRGHDEPRVSPNAGVMTTIGTTNVMVHYGRPSLKGRAVFAAGSELAPAGEVWRTGANEAAAITFADDVTFGGQPVPAGTYALFTIPGEPWTVILNKTAEQWGAFNYDAGEDLVRVQAEPMLDAPMQEQFEIRFADVSPEAGTLVLHWGTVGVPVEIREAE